MGPGLSQGSSMGLQTVTVEYGEIPPSTAPRNGAICAREMAHCGGDSRPDRLRRRGGVAARPGGGGLPLGWREG